MLQSASLLYIVSSTQELRVDGEESPIPVEAGGRLR